ncbi:long-chain acyl-CoA synthetase [Rhizobium subbaraonis]|uniref:Long-chain acyl-CoA synthetase n=1 Tax=Rhizobium subbaraonis TaxID=908946 RepID=A0A285V2E0_9HYPH|nr:AMP-binding protein [Rhizobium subbaraonis]SOC48193.1 long-chain acyl-CoA synthetase [Rhizobium subbaraonis]
MNIASWLARNGKANPMLPALGHGRRIVATYGELAERTARLAGGLATRLGVRPGDRVVIASKNDPDYVAALYAIWFAGGVAVPVNAKLHAHEIVFSIEDAGAAVVLASKDIAESLAAIAPQCLRHVVSLGGSEWNSLGSSDPVAPAARRPDDMAWLFYTSGTTGRPKGARLSHANLAAMSYAYLAEVDPTAPGDSTLHAAPMSHGAGLYMMAHILRGAINVVPETGGFDAGEVFELSTHWRRMSLFAAPTMVKRMVGAAGDFDPSGLRTIIYGGGPMYVEDAIAALDVFGPRLAQIYGQGETPMTITVLDKAAIAGRDRSNWRAALGSVGRPFGMVEVVVADTDGNPLPAGVSGEVLVRGPTVMSGYWNNEAATAATLKDGWLHTGDIGAVGEDGNLTLMDRSKDVIISGGSNIYPREVEEVLLVHPGIREVSVIGRPDPEWGEVVVAYVVGDAEPGALDTLCLERIARFKRPKEYVFVDALPKNNYGKIVKTTLREMDAGHRAR